MFWTWVRKQPKSQTRWEPAALTGLIFLHMLTQLIPLKLSHHYWVFSGFKGSKFTNFILKLWIFTHIFTVKTFQLFLLIWNFSVFISGSLIKPPTSRVIPLQSALTAAQVSSLPAGRLSVRSFTHFSFLRRRKWKREFCPTLGAAARLQTPSCFRSFLSKIHAATKCESLTFFDQKTQIFRAKIWRSLHKTDWSVLSL